MNDKTTILQNLRFQAHNAFGCATELRAQAKYVEDVAGKAVLFAQAEIYEQFAVTMLREVEDALPKEKIA